MSPNEIKMNGHFLTCLLGFLLLIQVVAIQSDKECEESKMLSIPVCHPEAQCIQFVFSYSCQWTDESRSGGKSPYVAVSHSQPDVPKTWNLYHPLPSPANECSESDKANIKLCKHGAKCIDLPRGYKCEVENPSTNYGNPYISNVCENEKDRNWICFRYVESVTSIENEIVSNTTNTNDFSVLESRLSDVLHVLESTSVSKKTLDMVFNDMNASFRITKLTIAKAERDSLKGSSLFTKSILVSEYAIDNYAIKIKQMGKYSTKDSATVEGINFAVKFIESNLNENHHKFLDNDEHVSIRIERTPKVTKDVAVSFTKVNENPKFFDLWRETCGSINVISSIVGVNVYEEIDMVITVNFTHKNVETEDDTFKRCVAWEPQHIAGKAYSSWNYEKCTVVNSIDPYKTTCECRQSKQEKMTYITLLLDLVEQEHSTPIFITTQLFCGICVLSLTILLICFRILKIHKSTFILVYFSAGLLFGNLFYLFGTYVGDVPYLCPTVAVLTHYCFLLALTWSVIFFIRLVYEIVKAIGNGISIRVRIYTLLGFGIPALIVVISTCLNYQHYGTNDRSCWISNTRKIRHSLMAPVLLAIVLNLVNCIVLGCTMRRKPATDLSKRVLFVEGLHGFIVTIFMGVIWTSAILMNVPSTGVYFAYVFAIFNGLQGFFMLAYCILLSQEKREKLSSIIREFKQSRKPPSAIQERALPIPLAVIENAQESTEKRQSKTKTNLKRNSEKDVYENSDEEEEFDAYEEPQDPYTVYDELDNTVYTSPTF